MGCPIASTWIGWSADSPAKPVLLYSRYYNAEGENRYLPDDTYKQVLAYQPLGDVSNTLFVVWAMYLCPSSHVSREVWQWVAK